jgi:NADPH:quinone reductase-like Zn-dependent oxidoreductase
MDAPPFDEITMRSLHLDADHPAAPLVARDAPAQPIAPNDVRVRVHAVSLNRRDLMIRAGTYPVPLMPGVVPVSDGAGEVIEAGRAVTRFGVGDRVTSTYFPQWTDGRLSLAQAMQQTGCSLPGWLADDVVVDEASVLAMPAHLGFDEAATLPCAGLTAWNGLTGGRPVRAGSTVLTLGAGSISVFAIQFAKALGARVIATTSSDDKAARLRSLGADEVVDYRQRADWDREVLRLTDGRGADHVIEAVGPATLERSLRCAAWDADIGLMGVFGTDDARLDPRAFSGRLLTLRRIAVGSRSDFEAMNRLISAHRLRPVIDRVFPIDQAEAAYRHLADGAHLGKVVIRVSG